MPTFQSWLGLSSDHSSSRSQPGAQPESFTRTKDAPLTWDIITVSGVLCQELEKETNIYIYYKSQYRSASTLKSELKDLFLRETSDTKVKGCAPCYECREYTSFLLSGTYCICMYIMFVLYISI